MDVSLVGPRGGGRVWVIWVIGGWNMSAVVVEKSTRDPCVDAGRRDECRGGWVTRDGTGDVDARVASRGSFGRERGGRASVVCVCVGFVRASREWTSRSRARRGFGFGFEQRIRVVSIDRGRAAGAIARAGSMASRAHHRCATGAQASVSRGRKMMRRSSAMGATRARAREVAGAVHAPRVGRTGRVGAAAAPGEGNRGDSCVASALSGKNGRGWTEKNVASADGKASTSKATGADGLGLGGGDGAGANARGSPRRRPGAPRAILESREMSMDGDDDAALLAAMEGVDLSALAAQVDKLSAEVDELDGAAARRRAPTEAELASLENSLMDDFEANSSVDIPDREKLGPEPSTNGAKKTRRRRAASASAGDDETALAAVENGVVTQGLAARSTRARAVARGVRSRPRKASVSDMVQNRSRDRVRGVTLEPRKQAQLARTNKRVSTDSMRSYLKDIGSVTLLNAKQEVELAKRIQDLMRLEGIRESLVDEENPDVEVTDQQWASAAGLNVQALHQRLRDGKAAKNEMIQANLRLVVSIAKKYANTNMSFQDLIQEGCVGLIRGAEKFDFERGYKFSTYAHWWIRQAVTRSISDQSRTIRLPVHLFEIISRISKMEQTFAIQHGRNPTVDEIASEMDMSAEKITQIKKAAQAPVSLAQKMGGDSKGRTIEETLVDIYAEGPEKVSGKSLLKEDLENVLNTLNPRERDVLRLRYGLDDGRVKTLEEIGTVFSVTRERIRQIEAKALRKLKQPSRNSILQEYYEAGDNKPASSAPSSQL